MVAKTIFRFKPFSKKQKQILNWWLAPNVKDMDGIIADGAVRSGKTLSMSLSFGLWAMTMFNGQNFIMSGKTVGSFRRNVLRDFKKMMEARGYEVQDKRSDNLVIISRGEITNYFYIFGGKDEASQDLVQGITAAGAFFDEVALMPESYVNQATARCSVEGSKFWFNCNPAGPQHWFKVNWIDKRGEKRLVYLHFTMADNLSLSQAIKDRYARQYTGVFFDRYIRGLWVAAEGIIYSMFAKDKHVKAISDDDLEWRVTISSDFGIQNANVFLFWMKVKSGAFKGAHYCYDELVYSGRDEKKQKTINQLVDDLEAKLKEFDRNGRHIEVEKIIIDPSAAAMIAELRRRGFRVVKASNDVIDGIADTSKLLQLLLLLFSEKCKNCIREFGLYMWDSKAADRGEDKPIKEHDHCMDGIRYYVRTNHLAKNCNEDIEEENLIFY